ncbi:MAG: NADH-quinone oxidoreductase subunit C, partial [candidate division WOR-3 bacterium]
LFKLDSTSPEIDSIADIIPGAQWAEQEAYELFGISFRGHQAKRIFLPDTWPDGIFPLRKDIPWNFSYEVHLNNSETNPDSMRTKELKDENRVSVVPIGPFNPLLDEPELFRLYVAGEKVVDCEYKGFMVHRGIEKLGESVLGYNDIPVVAERICGICGCVHNVAYVQAVEDAIGIEVPARGKFIRTIMLELERIHSHLLWIGLASHILGFDTMFMYAFRVREPIMWMAEKITGNRKTYSLCVVGGVRWDINSELVLELERVMNVLEEEWKKISNALKKDKNIQRRTRGIGIADSSLVRRYGLLGPVARAAGVSIDCRKDHCYAAYEEVEFNVITREEADVWARLMVRAEEIFESVNIIRQCLKKLPPGPIQIPIECEIPPGKFGMSSVEAPRGEDHHFVITGENNRPRRWKVRAPSYQNLQAIPEMVRGSLLQDMAISLGSIDPCFSCTDRMEVVDLDRGKVSLITKDELISHIRAPS